jgi:hypothetical protein
MKLPPRLGGSPRGLAFRQLSPLGSIIAGEARILRLRWGYSRSISPAIREACVNQFPDSEKFTVICVSTSTGSLFKI